MKHIFFPTLLVSLVCALSGCMTSSNPATSQVGCTQHNGMLLTNGRIHLMDEERQTSSSLLIRNDRIEAYGDAAIAEGTCAQQIDLNNRVVIPGLIDNHNHIVLLGHRPGFDTRLESADSIQSALKLLQDRAASVPEGRWITAIGGFDLAQLTPAGTEPRFPTRQELDSISPEHPVYLQLSFAGPGVTNSLGKAWLENKGIVVGEKGEIAGGGTPNPATQTLFELRQLQTFEDKKRGTLDALKYAAGLGITTHLDQGGFAATGTPADGAANMDPYQDYDTVIALNEEGQLINRIRINFLHMEDDEDTPQLQARLDNAFPFFGDPMLKTVGIGEFTAGSSPIIFQQSNAWLNGTLRVAEAGWRNENHSLTQGDYKTIIEGWEQVHQQLPAPGISDLRWVVAHVPFIDEEYAGRLKAIGGGVSVLGGWRYISGTAENNGPPFRLLSDNGIPMGMSSDGMQISPMNPWLGLYYVVTGRNARGELINEGQTLNREEAIALYTADNGWFLSEEDDLGTLEPGKYADLVVLSSDYFDEDEVSDEDIKSLHSVLTIVGGNIVHGELGSL